MSLPELSREEVRLGRFAAFCSAAYALAAVVFAVSAWLYHSAAPGVHLSTAPTQSAPELPAPPPPVRLTAGGKQP